MPIEPQALRIERFDPGRPDRTAFDYGIDRLNNYLSLSAKRQQKDDMTRVYVVVGEGSERILGYHAISLGTINLDEFKRRHRGAPGHREIPVLFLGQVAANRDAQGRGLGSILMQHVFEKASRVSSMAGCHAIVLDVISDGGEEASLRGKAWYESLSFATFVSNPARMFLVMKQVRAVIRARQEGADA